MRAHAWSVSAPLLELKAKEHLDSSIYVFRCCSRFHSLCSSLTCAIVTWLQNLNTRAQWWEKCAKFHGEAKHLKFECAVLVNEEKNDRPSCNNSKASSNTHAYSSWLCCCCNLVGRFFLRLQELHIQISNVLLLHETLRTSPTTVHVCSSSATMLLSHK